MAIQLVEAGGTDQRALDTYHRILYSLHEDDYPHFNGVLIRKNPLDLWTYLEILQKVKPDIIIETGTAKGGSALFFRDIQSRYNSEGWVLTIDEKPPPSVITATPQIAAFEGKSQDREILKKIKDYIGSSAKVFVSLDAGHLTHEVLAELELYAPLVTKNSYCVVEDTNIEGKPIGHEGIQGPGRAIEIYLSEHRDTVWKSDPRCERFGITFNPGGWLKRLS